MKKLIVLLLSIIMAQAIISQVPTTTSVSQEKATYLLKSKQLKRTGTILLVGGTVSFLPLAVLAYANGSQALAIVALLSLVAIPASIPFYVAGHKNKKKAMELTFIDDISPGFLKNSFASKVMPILGLRFRF
jgi:hypothetical protein